MNDSQIRERFREVLGRDAPRRLTVRTDTTEFMDIERDNILLLEGRAFAVLGNACEGRFGIDDQPKFWVKTAVDLGDGSRKFIKLVFHEQMISTLGPLTYRCMRSAEKEALILDKLSGDGRFMQGCSLRDDKGNVVRVIDRIVGTNLHSYLTGMHISHEEYFKTHFPSLFTRMISSVEAIAVLHKHNICHGDIRNDHIIVEKGTGLFRWIDFDLKQVSLDFDVWSLGNILFLVTAREDVTFRKVEKCEYHGVCGARVTNEDSLAFFPHRVANLQKLFPYIPDNLNEILMKFSTKALNELEQYKTVFALLDDLKYCCHDNGFDACPLITLDPLNPRGRTLS